MIEGVNSGSNYFNWNEGYEVGGEMQPRRSDELEVTINHTCECYQECTWGSCPCK